MTGTPKFSIVMPTRDRAHLLRFALRSALAQDHESYEIIVSDNCSTDDTREVVHEMRDERVRYVRTEDRLSMPDNWEFAFDHARGDYVTYLCDDDAISPGLLRRLDSLLAGTSTVSVGWRHSAYYHPDWPNDQERGKLFRPPATEGVQEVPSSSMLKKMFALDYDDRFPRLLDSCASRAFLDDRRRRMGRLFFPTCPDYSVAVATLTGTERITFIDEPLIACGLAGASNGSYGFANSNAIQTFMSEFSDLKKFWRIPLSSPTAYNQISVTLLGLKDVLAQELAPYSLSMGKLFVREHEQIKVMESRGADVTQALKEWEDALSLQSAEVCRSVREAIAPPSAESSPKLRHRLRAKIGIAVALAREALWGYDPASWRQDHFDDIFEAAKALDKSPIRT